MATVCSSGIAPNHAMTDNSKHDIKCDAPVCLKNVSVHFSSGFCLENLNVAFRRSEWTHIIGPNGAGKSTLLKIIAGILSPDSGTVWVENRDAKGLTPLERAQIMAYVPQSLEALPPIRGVDFVAQGIFAAQCVSHISSDDARLHAYQILAFMHLEALAYRTLNTLSGGERQMLLLCSAMAQNAKILLLDEPTSALDIRHIAAFYAAVRRMISRGITVISISHDLRQTARYADNVLLLANAACHAFEALSLPPKSLLLREFGVEQSDDFDDACRIAALRHKIPETPANHSALIANASPQNLCAESESIRIRPDVPPSLFVASYSILAILILILPWVGASSMAFPLDDTQTHILLNLRIPRVIWGAVSGGCLAFVGVAFQALFQNPLATPYTLGVASGASLGAMIAIQFGVVSLFALPCLAIVGGFASLFAVIFIAMRFGLRSPLYCLMAGVATSLFCSACGLVVQAFATPMTAQQMMRWQLGGLEIVGYDDFILFLPIAAAIVLVLQQASSLSLLSVDSELATARGVSVTRVQTTTILAAGMAVSAVVAICGPIGFVGLIVPNAIRKRYNADVKAQFLLALPLGAIAILLADAVSRLLENLTWLPVGVIVALLGVPIFVVFLLKK